MYMSKKEKELIIFIFFILSILFSMILIFNFKKNYLLNEIEAQEKIIRKEEIKFNLSNKKYNNIKKEYESYVDQEKDIDTVIKELEDKNNE